MQEIINMNSVFDEFFALVNAKSLNYVADIRFFEAPGLGGQSADVIVKSCFGSVAEIGKTSIANVDDVLVELKAGLEYQGDEGSHPNTEFVGSAQHQNQVNEIMRCMNNLVLKSTQIIGLWLKEGHPYYPVFWDFAFIIEFDVQAYVLIGSSSD